MAARARATRLRMPPLSSEGHLCSWLGRSTILSARCTSDWISVSVDSAFFAQGEGDVFADGERIEKRAVLEEHAGFLAQRHQLLLVHLGEVLVAEPNLPRIGLHEGDDVLEQHAFAAAAAADDDHAFRPARISRFTPSKHFLPAEFLFHADQSYQRLGVVISRS